MRPLDLPCNAILATRNLLRSMQRKGLEGIVLPISGSYPEHAAPRDPLPFPFNRLPLFPTEMTLEDMRTVMDVIGGDGRVQTVVLRFDGLGAHVSALYSLRHMLLGLRGRGKRLVAWLRTASTWDYYVASACDEVILAPSGGLLALGLRAEPVFLRDVLALVGAQADLEAIAEYKVAPDTFRRSTMSEPHREMLDAILDSLFGEFVVAVAEGRGLDPARVRELIDAMPLSPLDAVRAGLADAVLYEDELPGRLAGAPSPSQGEGRGEGPPSPSQGEGRGEGKESGALVTWHQAAHRLHRPIKWATRQVIGVVSLEGLIVPGHGRRVPVPLPLPFVEAQAGAETVIQALRRAEADSRIAAVIFHVETPGGSALCSDLICQEVRRLRERKPVIVLMGGQATSGGYYVSALAQRIVTRPTTLTGSIGIWGGKLVLAGLYEKLKVGREAVQRGAMAGLYSEMAPFDDAERARIRAELGESYARFKARVAEGRSMTEDQVEEIARGRVWTGAQAREIGLVDELGGFETALVLAKELAGLKPEREYTVVQVHPPRHELLPPQRVGESANQRVAIRQSVLSLPQEQAGGEGLVALINLLAGLARERVWALAPWMLWIRG